MDKKQITAFAKKNGYDSVAPLGKWKEYDAYEPIFKGATEKDPAAVGPPLLILVKGDTIRMSTVEEAFAQIADSDDEEPDAD